MEGLLSTGPTPSSFKERWPDGGQDEEVQALQEGADQVDKYLVLAPLGD